MGRQSSLPPSAAGLFWSVALKLPGNTLHVPLYLPGQPKLSVTSVVHGSEASLPALPLIVIALRTKIEIFF